MRNCGELLLLLLQEYGVDTVFGIPGNHTVALYRGLAGSNIRHISPRHEQGAGFMADGYARSSGRPGVCILISGPGLTNAVTPMMQALADSVPMLVITAVAPTHQLGMGGGCLHELPDQRALAAQCTRFSHTLLSPDQLPEVLARAFAVFSCQRPGPVHIEIPLDVMVADASHITAKAWPQPLPPVANARAVAEAAALLSQAHRPLLLLGGGAVAAAPQLLALAEKLNTPVINTVNGKGLLSPQHRLSVGGSPSLSSVRQLLVEADVLLVVGSELGETDCDMLFLGELTTPAKVLRIDIDGAQLCRNLRPTVSLCGDAQATVNALLPLLRQRDDSAVDQRVRNVQAAIAAETHYQLELQALFDTLNTALPDLVLVGDSTLPTYYAVWQYQAAEPRSYFHSASGGGTLGYAIPAALGAKLAHPQRPVAALIGDGAAQFTLAELAAGAQLGLSVAVLIWNNNGYREIENGMRAVDITPEGVAVEPPNFEALAVAMHCAYARPSNLAALSAALVASRDRSGPTVIELQQRDFVSGEVGQWY